MSPSLRIRYPSPRQLVQAGPVVDIEISSGRAGTPTVKGKGLIDTGASVTFVTPQVVERARLQVLRTTPPISFSTVNDDGTGRSPVYGARVSVVGLPTAEITRCYLAQSLPGDVIALLGRDLLRRGTLLYDGPRGQIDLSHNG